MALDDLQLDEAGKSDLYRRLRRPDLFDRCHKYGWIITFLGTLLMQVVIWSVTIGSFKQSVEDMKKDFGARIERLERQIDSLTRITRGEGR